MVGGIIAALAALIAGIGPAAAADRLGVGRDDPAHLPPRVAPEPLEPPPPAEHIIRADDHLVYRLPEPVDKWAAIDRKLSRLCEVGAFRQRRNLGLYAYAPGITYGVGFAEGYNLEDPQGVAKPGMVYFFVRPDTERCLVLAARQSKVKPYATLRFAASPASGAPAKP